MKVVLATDGSDNSRSALHLLRTIAGNQPMMVRVVNIVRSPDELYFTEAFDLVEYYRKKAAERAKVVLDENLAVLGDHVIQAETATREGHPGQEICHLAHEYGADLIVVGARGNSAIDRILMGSTSEFVTNHAHCSVLVVRNPQTNATEHRRGLRITLAEDGSLSAHVARQIISEFRWPNGTQVDIVAVVEHPSMIPDDVPYDPDLSKATHATLVGIADQLQKSFAKVDTRVIESVDAGLGLCDFARQNNTDILVVGDRGRSAIA